jgi:hypothetical protein
MAARPPSKSSATTATSTAQTIRSLTAQKLDLYTRLRELDLEAAKLDSQLLELGIDPGKLMVCW